MEGSAPGRRRLVVGVVLLVVGLAALGAVLLGGDGDGEREVGKLIGSDGLEAGSAASTSPDEPTGSTPAPAADDAPRTPTTLPDGALPAGCGDWDPAFGFPPEEVASVAIWSDFQGWHVRLAPDGPASIQGRVVGVVTPVRSAAAPTGDVEVAVDEAARAVAFTIRAGAEPAGFDLQAACDQKQLTFELLGPDGQPLDPATVQVGRDGRAAVVPVVAQRVPAG